MDWMPQAVRDGILVVLIISGPIVLAAAGIGLVIGILQAATQVQEQTIGSAAKIIAVFLLIIVGGFWMLQYLNNYTSKTLSTAFTFVPRRTQKVVPTNAFNKDDAKFDVTFEGESAPQPPVMLLQAEKLELPPSGVAPYLGAPEIPKPKPITNVLPPVPSEVPKQPLVPKLPLSNYQEPVPIKQQGDQFGGNNQPGQFSQDTQNKQNLQNEQIQQNVQNTENIKTNLESPESVIAPVEQQTTNPASNEGTVVEPVYQKQETFKGLDNGTVIQTQELIEQKPVDSILPPDSNIQESNPLQNNQQVNPGIAPNSQQDIAPQNAPPANNVPADDSDETVPTWLN